MDVQPGKFFFTRIGGLISIETLLIYIFKKMKTWEKITLKKWGIQCKFF